MIAVVRIRGSVNVKKDIKDTLKMLRLKRVNHCVLVPKNENYAGMLKKVESYVTYGEISLDVLEKLILKRGRVMNKKLNQSEAKKVANKIMQEKSLKNLGLNPVFRLSPPSKGHKKIRKQYPKGALGHRSGNINELLKRMI